MPLSDTAIRKARGREKPYRLTDERGLYVLVQPDGARWWRLDFTLNGKRRTMGLGVYPDVELGDAREKRDRFRKLIAVGIDPVKHRRTGAGEADASFKAVALQWFEANRHEWSDRTYAVKKRRFEQHIFPEIGHKDIRAIEPPEMLRIIRQIEDRGTTDLPRRMRADCGSVFRFAIASGWETRDATADIKGALKKRKKTVHRAFIRPGDMGEFLLKLSEDQKEDQDTKDALLLTILTAVRTDELRFAHKSEFEDINCEKPLWRIPKERMKMDREHLSPLSSQAAAIVRRRLEELPERQSLLFGRGTKSGTISENTMLYGLYRLGYHSRATVHGFRRTFSTLANEATKVVDGEEVPMWHPDWVERCLAHVPEDQVRAAYNAAEYLPQRRRLLQWWADWLDAQRENAQVRRLIG
ncbi:tyrosine-type recombinase/integrase [Sphingomonas limnosediminicola]|uniref:Tyrosine-type recombinase/integrase n=1 Tax=Sphingomonas limnosediminicola TaxID=940133 RepID=A0ABP7L737_9SPHN